MIANHDGQVEKRAHPENFEDTFEEHDSSVANENTEDLETEE